MITDNIAIGNHKSDYSDFDIIVNLNFPDNMMEEREIKKTITLTHKKKPLLKQ
jgi:hypothetical protein